MPNNKNLISGSFVSVLVTLAFAASAATPVNPINSETDNFTLRATSVNAAQLNGSADTNRAHDLACKINYRHYYHMRLRVHAKFVKSTNPADPTANVKDVTAYYGLAKRVVLHPAGVDRHVNSGLFISDYVFPEVADLDRISLTVPGHDMYKRGIALAPTAIVLFDGPGKDKLNYSCYINMRSV